MSPRNVPRANGRSGRVVLGAALLLVAVPLAGCVAQDGDGGEPLYGSFEEARDAPGFTLQPSTATEPELWVRILAPLGFQALPEGPADVAVLLYSPRGQEPVEDATLSVQTDRGASATLAHDAHGVYAGTLEVAGSGKTPARVTAVLDDGTNLVFPFELASFAGADAAAQAGALTYGPVAGDAPLQLGLISPREPLRTQAEKMPLVFQLLDTESGEPVPDAQASLATWMPPHGLPGGGQMPPHGTHSEVDPVHHRFGVYQGVAFPLMNGTWWTNVSVALQDGSSAHFRLTFDVGTGSHTHEEADGHEDHDHSHSFNSFAEAMEADGPLLDMTSADGARTLTAKLLLPDADDAGQGNQSIMFLLTEEEAGRPVPVPVGDVELDIHKHAAEDEVVGADTSEVVHSGHGVWMANANLSEDGTWSTHVTVQLPDGSTFGDKWEITVGEGSAGDHDHDHGDHDHE